MTRTITVTRSMASAAVDSTTTPPSFNVTLDCGHVVKAPPLVQLGQDMACPTCANLAAAAPGLPG